MLKIYDPFGNKMPPLQQYTDLSITEEINQLNILTFNIPLDAAGNVMHEGKVELENEGRYVIKEKNLNNGYEVVAMYDLEDLQGFIESKAFVTLTIQEMMADLLTDTGWTFESSITQKRTATGVTIDRLDFIYAIVRDTFKLEINFDNQSKIIKAEPFIGNDKAVPFHNEINLVELSTDADTYDFATRIIPRGKDGLSIEAINDGIPYVENLTYSSKIITRYWSDERYTNIEQLKSDAQDLVDRLSVVLKSYSVKVMDLAKSSGINTLEFCIGDVIEIIDNASQTRDKQRIIIRQRFLDEPDKDTVTIANRMRSLNDSIQDNFDGVKQDFSVIRSSLELLDTAVQAKVSQNDYNEDKEEMDNAYAAFKLEYDKFTVTVQSGGGNNLIKNSVGYADDRFWDVYWGEFETTRSTWVLQGEAKHGIKLKNGTTFLQSVPLVEGETYTLSAKVKKGIAGSFDMTMDDYMAAYLTFALSLSNGEAYDGIVSHEFIYDGSAFDPCISIGTSGAAEVEITDLMLARGKNINYWSQANGETYTLKVQTDEDGVRVFRVDGKGYTIMSPEEFAGYYNNQKIFTLNGDITEVMGLEIKGKGLWMRPIKVVQTNSSLDFVWTGR